MQTSACDLDLPEAEFSYIGRPWDTFIGRWEAIRRTLLDVLPVGSAESFRPTVIDLGSNNGFFSLQIANVLAGSSVIGVEGAVGVGNGTMGTRTNEWLALCQTSAIQTHLRWVQKTQLPNCFLAPEVWDYDYILSLAERGMCADLMLSLSVVHHIDEHSASCYLRHPELASKQNRVEAFLQLMRRLLQLANTHIIELPDSPWISHVHEAFQNDPMKILEAACERTEFSWDMQKIYSSGKWIGHREVWVLRRKTNANKTMFGFSTLRPFFNVLLPPPQGEERVQEVVDLLADALSSKPLLPSATKSSSSGEAPTEEEMGIAFAIVGTCLFVSEALLGLWVNSQGRKISVELQESDRSEVCCRVQYQKDSMDGGGEDFPLSWVSGGSEDGHWRLSNHMGHFALVRASASHLCWVSLSERPWRTTWKRSLN